MRVVAVIPALNEEGTVARVVEVVRGSHLVEEVVVVSDGSTDGTAGVARSAGARVIELPVNVGKGGAMRVGVDSAPAEAYLFLDADLVGLTEHHVQKLLNPVLVGQVSMTLGLFGGGRLLTDLAHRLAPFLSGQRAVTTEVLRRISDLEVSRFGVEVALSRYVRESRLPVRHVTLRDLSHRMKEEKLGFWRGVKARARMYLEIAYYLQRAGRG